MAARAKLYGGIYDGEEMELASFMPIIPRPVPETAGAIQFRMLYRLVGLHPNQQWFMYVWREEDGYVPR